MTILNNQSKPSMLEFNGGEYSSRSPQGGSNYTYNRELLASNSGYSGAGYPGVSNNVKAAAGLYSGGNKLTQNNHQNGLIGTKTGGYSYKKGGSSCKIGGTYCNAKGGGKNMKKSRKNNKRNKRLNKSSKNKSRLNKSRKNKSRKNKSRLNKSRKNKKRYNLKGGNNQPYSNVPMSYSYTLNGGDITPTTSALATPIPIMSVLNC